MATLKDPREWEDIKAHVNKIESLDDIPKLLNSLVDIEEDGSVVEKENYIDVTDFIHESRMLPISIMIKARGTMEQIAEHRLFLIHKYKTKSASIMPYRFIAIYTTENI